MSTVFLKREESSNVLGRVPCRTPYEEVVLNEVSKITSAVLGTLTNREEEVLRLRFGLDGSSETLMSIGRMYNLSASRIRHIESKALRKLRHPTRKDILAVLVPEHWIC